MQRARATRSRILGFTVLATALLGAASAQTTSIAPSNPGATTVFGTPAVVHPGTESGPLPAMGCEQDTTNLCLPCTTSCDAGSNEVGAGIGTLFLPFGKRFAKASLFTDFVVGSTPQTEENLVPATIRYDLDWIGSWAIAGILGTGVGSAKAEITISLEDQTDDLVLVTETFHSEEPDDQIGIDIVNLGAWVDTGDLESSFTSLLRRGHAYRIRLTLFIEVIYVIPTASYTLSYGPVGWNSLTVTVGEDPRALAAGVAAKPVDDFIALTGGNVTDCLATHTITTPQAGWVHVTATCQANAFHQTGTVTQANFGVTDDVEVLPTNQDLAFSVSSGYPSGTLVAPVTAQAVFPVANAGPHTFYFMGKSTSGGMSVHDIQLTLVYLPETYGTVGLPIQVASGAPTFEQESSGSPRPALLPSEILAQREGEIREYRRRLDEQALEVERLREEVRVLRESMRRQGERTPRNR